MVKGRQNGGARHQTDVGQAGQFGHDGCGPTGPALVTNHKSFGIQPPAHAEILIRQDHPRPGPTRRQRRLQARRTRADDQQVTVQKALVIAVGVLQPAERPEARSAADDRLIQLFPERGRPHEGLVVKPRRQKRIETVVDGQRVKPQAGPAVLALRRQPVEQLGHGGAGVGFLPRAGTQFDQRIRLLGPRRNNPARAVVFEAAPHQPHAVGQQGRGEGVARMAVIGQPVEMKAQGLAAVDLARRKSGRKAVYLRHLERPCARATSRAISTLLISWLSVLRVTTSHDRSPCS